jgi:hypothetical protein
MKNKLLLILLVLLLVPIVSATDAYNFKQGTEANLKVSCFDDNNILCTVATSCFITVIQPDSTTLVSNGTMTRSTTFYNYSLTTTQTQNIGQYAAMVYCSGTTNAYTQFNFLITESGVAPVAANRVVIPLYLAIFSFMLLVISIAIGSKIVGAIAGMAFTSNGVYMMIYGLQNFTSLYTRILAFTSLGIGIIILIVAAYEALEKDEIASDMSVA